MNASDLIQFRKRFKLNQKQAAKALGCSPKSVYNWEKGHTNIPKSISLAMTAYAMNLPGYGEKDLT